MRILIYGAGVIGGNLANNFFKAGKDVTILARGEWYENLVKNGLIIKHQYSYKKDISRLKVIKELLPDDYYDIIFVVMRYSQIDSIAEVLLKNASKNIVLVGNNVRADYYSEKFAGKNLLFGFSLSAGHREKDRIVSIDLKKITIGQLKEKSSNESLIKEVFKGTRLKVVYEPNMGDYLLCHAAFIIPITFACYYTDGNLKKIHRDKGYIDRVIKANIEGYCAIKNSGHEIVPASDDNFMSEKFYKKMYWFLKLMCATKLGKICASDHALSATDEIRELNEDIKQFFDEHHAKYENWKWLESGTKGYLLNSKCFENKRLS